jgi:hypothetical protein
MTRLLPRAPNNIATDTKNHPELVEGSWFDKLTMIIYRLDTFRASVLPST